MGQIQIRVIAIISENQNPQLIIPEPQTFKFIVKGIDSTNQIALDTNRKQQVIPIIEPLMNEALELIGTQQL